MANIALLVDPEEMRVVSRSISALTDEFDTLRNELKNAIGNELNSACSGDVADEFTRYYNENIDVKLVEEKERLDTVAATLNNSANSFDETVQTVKSSF